MPMVLSACVATLATQDLLEALQKPTPKTPFAKTNYTRHTTLISIAVLFNIIPKAEEKNQLTGATDGGGRWLLNHTK